MTFKLPNNNKSNRKLKNKTFDKKITRQILRPLICITKYRDTNLN